MYTFIEKFPLLTKAKVSGHIDTKAKVFGYIDTKAKVSGHIDTVEAGFIRGWVAVAGNDKTFDVTVKANDKVAGKGRANLFRSDLVDAGFNNGNHGFLISFDGVFEAGQKIEFKLIDSHSNTDYTIETKEVEIPRQQYRAEMSRVEDYNLIGGLYSNVALGKQTLIVLDGSTIVAEMGVDSNENQIPFRIPLPTALFDDQAHHLMLGMADYPLALAQHILTLKTFNTPWKFLKESYQQSGFMGMSSQARSRYESLHHQLEAIAKGEARITNYDLVTAHRIVVKGFKGRKEYPKFNIPEFENPKVSIIIPVYNQIELTYHCLASIALSYNITPYEVILADDNSTDQTQEIDKLVGNLKISRNKENLKFLRTCNRASKLVMADFIVFLNNDTEVTSFWLDELIAPFEADKNVGQTGSKLLNSDGSLQEAGGIVWCNGQPWNVGRDTNAKQPEFNYKRDVDYLSGAALCIPQKVWEEVGHFSDEFAPAYYEDTDLAFKVRNAGYKTVYVPNSEVVHFEGMSNGRDKTKGVKRYQVINEPKFRAKWFKDYRHNGRVGVDIHLMKDRNIDHRVLMIDYTTPAPNQDAGGYAALQEIKLMQSLGIKVTFVPENLAYLGKNTARLQRMGVEVLYAPFYCSVQEVIERRIQEMDAVYITRYDVAEKYIELIREKSQAKIIFNNADLHFLRELRMAISHKDGLSGPLKTRDRELSVMRKVDAILSYNETEHAVILSHNLKSDNIFKCPWVLEEKLEGKTFEKRQGIAFLGGYRHLPNIEAVKFFAKEVMPLLVKKLPEAKFYIYGSHITPDVEALACEHVVVAGWVENLDEVFHNCRVFVAPLKSGAGIKGKVLEAMAYGVPIVLTDVAAEGTGLSHKISALFAVEPEEWVRHVSALHKDGTLWKRLADNSKILVSEHYTLNHGKEKFREIFKSVGLHTYQ